MPHKRNPVIAEGVVAVGRALRWTVGMMHEALVLEHERDASVWRLEWKALPEICLMTGAILGQMKYILKDLEVRTDKMRANLDLLGGFLLSERVMFALADKVGKQSAHEMVYEAAMHGMTGNVTFEQALMADPRVKQALGRRRTQAAARSDHLHRPSAGDRRARTCRDARLWVDSVRWNSLYNYFPFSTYLPPSLRESLSAA